MNLRFNEERLRQNGELNLQAEMSLKMIEEFRLRLGEVEHMQNKFTASLDILDIRTKGGVGQLIPQVPSAT